MRRRTFLAALTVLVPLACDDAPGAAPPGAALPEWTLSASPALTLGGAAADPDHELYQAMSALRREDGRVLVANAGNHELRYYASDGRLLRTVGRKGDGPGEFQGIWAVAPVRGDSLAVWDWRAKRLTVYDDAGEFARLVSATDAGTFSPRLLGAADDGASFVLIAGFNPENAVATGGGRWQDTRHLLRYPLDGGPPDSLGPFPVADRWVDIGDRGFGLWDIPFGRREHLVVGGGRVLVGDDRTGDIAVHAVDGELIRIIRTGFANRPVTNADMEAYQRDQLEGLDPAAVPEYRRRFDILPPAKRTPAFDDLWADRLGRAWVAEFTLPGTDPDAPRAWTVFDPDGHAIARLTLPLRARPTDAGEDYVLVYSRDDLDVERLDLYGLLRPEP